MDFTPFQRSNVVLNSPIPISIAIIPIRVGITHNHGLSSLFARSFSKITVHYILLKACTGSPIPIKIPIAVHLEPNNSPDQWQIACSLCSICSIFLFDSLTSIVRRPTKINDNYSDIQYDCQESIWSCAIICSLDFSEINYDKLIKQDLL